ncbi:hypothetical protein [Streptomyces sp. NBC_01235]|uniref:hypothetical protein n=1 Tax=Streptomyces sp. NBC_01235 TaxID=2903788 RepID=UPI002E15FB20|nr:hypothetical protein OG289_04310 [Streptomyces sp. NBC_01235]
MSPSAAGAVVSATGRRRGEQCAVGPVDGGSRVDQRDVAERLREVSEQFAVAWVDLQTELLPGRWAGTVLLVGAGKSAQAAARDLAALPGTRVEWAVRSPAPDWGAVPDDTLHGRRQLVDTSQALADGANGPSAWPSARCWGPTPRK